MNRSKTYLALGLIVAVLALGVAYAAIGNIKLNISGTATATAAAGSFDVQFVGGETSGDGSATFTQFSESTRGLAAEFTVTGLDHVGDKQKVIFTIENKSTDLLANLTFSEATCDKADYFKVTSKLNASQLGTAKTGANCTTTVEVEVELLKLPVATDSVEANISAFVEASPANPTV